MAPAPAPTLSVVVVTYGHAAALPALHAGLGLREGDELVVVDNASPDASAEVARSLGARVIANEANLGFAAACDQGAAAATGDLLLLLNPDSVPGPGFRDAITRPWGGPYAAWQGLVMAGDVVNTSGGVVHFTGVAWSGESGRARPAAEGTCEVGFASGACLALPRASWPGFPAEFFMYCEDVDLSLRLRLAGGAVGVEPRAVVDHDYSFAKGAAKWRMLERNRWATVLRTYPAPLLALVAPALVLTELALWPVALAGGWGRAKALATLDVVRALPRLRRERRAIQAARTISPRAFADGLTAELSSPDLGPVGRVRVLQWGLRAYWRTVLTLLPGS